MKARLVVLLGLAPLPVQAEDLRRPESGYFTGVYERIGKTASEPPLLIDDLVRIAPVAPGWGLSLHSCENGGKRSNQPVELRPGLHDEVPNILETQEGPDGFWCQYFNDHSNYPILACQSDNGARFTLWPVTDARMVACMTAAGQSLPGME